MESGSRKRPCTLHELQLNHNGASAPPCFSLLPFSFCFNLTIRASRFYILKYKTLKTILESHSRFKMASYHPLSFPSPCSSTQQLWVRLLFIRVRLIFLTSLALKAALGALIACLHSVLCIISANTKGPSYRESHHQVLNKVTNICSSTVRDTDRPPSYVSC